MPEMEYVLGLKLSSVQYLNNASLCLLSRSNVMISEAALVTWVGLEVAVIPECLASAPSMSVSVTTVDVNRFVWTRKTHSTVSATWDSPCSVTDSIVPVRMCIHIHTAHAPNYM